MGRCKGYKCLKYNDDICCYECEEQKKCSVVCETVQEQKKCRFYDVHTKEEREIIKKTTACNVIRDVTGVTAWVLMAIGAVELLGDLRGTIAFAMIIIAVWILPDKERGEKYENNF